MQLSAPASFPETLVPASSGETAADSLTEGEVASDFAALFAGLTRPPAPPPGPAGKPVPGALSGDAVVSTLRMQLEAAGLMGAVPGLLPVEPPPAAVGEEGADVQGLEDLAASLVPEGGVAPMPLVPAGLVAATVPAAGSGARTPEGAQAQRGQPLGASAPHAASLPVIPVPPPAAAAGPSPAGVDAPVADARSPTAIPSLADEVGAWSGDARRAANAAAHAADPSLRGLKRGPATVAGNESGGAPANIAAAASRSAALASGGNGTLEKNFLNVEGEDLKEGESPLGTGVAFKESAMTSSAPASTSPAVLSATVAPREVAFDLGLASSADAKATVPEPVERLAHRAVEAVAATIERSAAQPAQSVNLKFAVQGVDLMVRVALRADEVQVTFRTDSEDLRNALAHEWQVVRGRDPEGVLQSVTPVFTAGESGTSTSQHQTGGRDQAAAFAQLQAQADGQHSRPFGRPPASAAPPSAPQASAAGPAGVSVPRVSPQEATGASRLLHTFA